MGHSHDHNEHRDSKNLMVAFLLNLLFTIIEIVGGLLTNSVAILSDAIHDLGDTFSLGLAYYFQRISKKEKDAKFSYGYKRYSVLGALINGVILFFGCIYIFVETIPRLIEPEDVDSKGMLYLSILGIVINSAAVFRLRKGKSLNEKVVSLHLLEDVLGWVAVFLGSIVMLIWDVKIIDPILSLGIAIYILLNIYKNLKTALKVILQHTPDNVNYESIHSFIADQEFVKGVHDLHIWSLDGNYNVMSVNIAVNEGLNIKEILILKEKLKNDLESFNVHHSTIELIQ